MERYTNRDATVGAAMHGVSHLLKLCGENIGRDGLRDTPRRVVKSFLEMTKGYNDDPQEILSATFQDDCDEMVVLRGASFISLCEHHLMPFIGTASMAYIPNGRVVGISKLARLVDCFARRLQIQEKLTQQIAESIMNVLNPKGCGIIIRASHMCMQ